MPLSRIKKSFYRFEQYTIDVIYGRRCGKAATVYGVFLEANSWIFSALVQARFWLYRHRIFHDQPLGCLVVVVGNLTVGGTGKTPVVEKFARSLAERGRKVAILSRGYKSKPPPLRERLRLRLLGRGSRNTVTKVVSDGRRVLLDSEAAGDEPFMLARNLPGVIVLVDKNRVRSGSYAIRKFGCDTLVLDDGLQYLPLKARLNLLLVDKTNPFGNGHLLPRGILREPVKHLRRASYIFLTKSDGRRDEELERTLRRHNPRAEIIECAHRPQYLQRLGTKEQRDLDFLQGRPVGAFSGIATPENFEAFLRGYGAQLFYTKRFLDHYRFTAEDLEMIFTQAMEARLDLLVTTEKDAVRIPPGMDFPLPLYYLRLEIEIIRGAPDFEEAVSRICFPEFRSRPLAGRLAD